MDNEGLLSYRQQAMTYRPTYWGMRNLASYQNGKIEKRRDY